MRITVAVRRRAKKKKLLKKVKGYYGTKHVSFRSAKEQWMKGLSYSYRDRKVRGRQFRKKWISEIAVELRKFGKKYSIFINELSSASLPVRINRRGLAGMLEQSDTAFFRAIYELVIKNKKVAEGDKFGVKA